MIKSNICGVWLDRLEIAYGDFPPKDAPYTAVIAKDRQDFLIFFDVYKAHQQERGGEQDYAFRITMPCGYSKKFKEYTDLPLVDLPCNCGQANRYLIRYRKGVG